MRGHEIGGQQGLRNTRNELLQARMSPSKYRSTTLLSQYGAIERQANVDLVVIAVRGQVGVPVVNRGVPRERQAKGATSGASSKGELPQVVV